MEKQTHKELLQDHSTSKWQQLNANSGLLTDFNAQKGKGKKWNVSQKTRAI